MSKAPYTHLLPREREIWERYLETNPLDLFNFRYDVHLGKGLTIFPFPEDIKPLVEMVTKKRVDVVAESRDFIYLIEIKPRAGMSALGQLITYELLFKEEYKPTKPIKKLVICERIEPDLALSYKEHDIEVVIV